MGWFGVRHGSNCLWRDGFLSWSFTAAEYPGAPFARQGRELAHLILQPSRGDRQAGYDRDKTHLAHDRRRSVLWRAATVDRLEIRYCRRVFVRANRLRGRRRYRSVGGTHCPLFHPARRARLVGLGLLGPAAHAGRLVPDEDQSLCRFPGQLIGRIRRTGTARRVIRSAACATRYDLRCCTAGASRTRGAHDEPLKVFWFRLFDELDREAIG
jgi:hypothetical protein